MKKGLVLAFSLLLLCVAGCSNLKNVPIDAYVWKITVIQEKTKIQENQKGDVIACAPEFISSYKGAAEIDLTCEAKMGVSPLRMLGAIKATKANIVWRRGARKAQFTKSSWAKLRAMR